MYTLNWKTEKASNSIFEIKSTVNNPITFHESKQMQGANWEQECCPPTHFSIMFSLAMLYNCEINTNKAD